MKMRIGHAHLKVRDLERATAFYERFLGLEVRERLPDRYVFMSGGPLHHELALQRVPPDARLPGRYDVGLFHIAFEVPDKASFARAYRTLEEAGVPVALVDHRISWAMYFADPDGNGLEIYCDTRSEPDGVELWEASDRPLSAKQVLAFADQGS
jgi:catechol 2,3-dioxygenase